MDTELIDFFKQDPFASRLNIELLECDTGFAKTGLTIEDDMLNFHGYAHGGLLFSLADYAFAIASNSHGQIAVGLNVHMSYLEPAKEGDRLICTASEKKRTPKIAVYDIQIQLSTGEVVATMEGMVYIKKTNFISKLAVSGERDS
ncbi:hydroxyphenylacetyl-CoA thioesterase PaaI [Virgibacillus ihumii]|uniref:hydroxyphenylacetyl-CoA thioesterase PaaI n=1 Tax=Virgibacillus ihumii TaxID=2686091 RepID=UPI00157DA3A5|nr:hydroxyphenylacetyl-CoA thioesterase PaaI [Virgibacillus ihumii]